MDYQRFPDNYNESKYKFINFDFKTNFKQIYLLLWKNYSLQKRSIIGTILEILVPALFVIILIPIRKIVRSDQYLNNTIFPTFTFNALPDHLMPFYEYESLEKRYNQQKKNLSAGLWTLGYQPNNSILINNIMRKVSNDLTVNLVGFQDEDKMVNYINDPNHSKLILGGISFLNQSIDNFIYKIRLSYSPKYIGQTGFFNKDLDWKTNLLFSIFPILGPREKNDFEGGDPGYYREGFLSLQKAIDFALISQFNDTIDSIDLKLKRFPYPPYNDDKFVPIIIAMFPFIIMLSFIFTVILTAKAIVYEKETGIKEAMKLMGMKSWIYWLSWYIKTMLLLVPSLVFMIISFKIKINLSSGGSASIIDKTDAFLFASFLFLYASSSITFTFLCTTFFKKANSAAAGTGIIWFFSYLPYLFISLRYEKMSLLQKILALFVNNLAMSEGVQMIGMFEGKETGINFSNWTKGISIDDSFTMFTIMTIMFLNNFIHLILMYYFDNILPGDHGIAKPWNFPILSFISLFKKRNCESNDNFINDSKSNKNVAFIENDISKENLSSNFPVYIEDESAYSSRKIGIKIKNITKKFKQFGQVKKAVNNLSLNIYEGQISVLLGHNGAGKSTTISMITGLAEPNNGSILINDIDIVKNTKEARKFIGFCPQYNLLLDDLTVYEHLKFFSKLKENFDEQEIDNMLDIINLSDKKHALAKTLSGGMKRKLCVAIAFIGNSSIVILDEPSSGMDPQARHSTWSLLQKFKKEKKCTILLTTHFMDEADFLGDRIAIMSKGTLRCCGSPLYLKSKYGSGYNLVISKKKINYFNDMIENLSTNEKINNHNKTDNQIIDLVKNIIPNSKLNTNINTEISFILPYDETNKFSYLFDELEKNKDFLNIMNIGVSITTVEDVFLKIGELENCEGINEIEKAKISTSLNNNSGYLPSLNGDLEQPIRLNNDEFDNIGLWTGSKNEDLVYGMLFILQQFKALFFKRFIHSIRNKTLVISQIIIPIIFLLVNLVYIKYAPIKAEDSPPLHISINKYSNNFIPIKLGFYNSSPISDMTNNLSNLYQQTLNSSKNSFFFNLESNKTVSLCLNSRNNIDDFIGCLGRLSFSYIIDDYLVGTDFNIYNNKSVEIIGHFNNQPYHIPPLALNLITNTLFKYYSSINNKITVINHPLPRNLKEKLDDLQIKNMAGFNIASGLTFGFSFLIASFAVFLIKEKSSDAKHLQYLSGCNSFVFWISSLIWDIFNYLLSIMFVPILLKIFGIDEFVGGVRWIYVVVLLSMYGFAHIPQMYLFSYFFKVSATGFAALVAWNILSSQVTLTPTQILTLPQLELVDVSKILEWIFIIIFPNFAFGQGLIDLYNNYQISSICKPFLELCDIVPNPCCVNFNTSNPKRCGKESDCLLWCDDYMAWEKPGLLRFFIFMPMQFIVFFGIILIYETGYFRYIKYNIKRLLKLDSNKLNNDRQKAITNEYDDIKKDEDVINEENRISDLVLNKNQNNNIDNEIFIVDRITKYYSDFMAVKGISFALKPYECFGLLGVNGAGKSTSFKMLTGDEFITKGDAFINDTSIKNDIKKVIEIILKLFLSFKILSNKIKNKL
nr:ATP-binding cassette transporter Abca3-1 [Brachionus angularis]